MALTAAVATVGPGNGYTLLGVSPATGMWISAEGEIEIIIAASTPAAGAPGHPCGMESNPLFCPLAGSVYAMSPSGAPVSVTVTY